MKLIYLTFISLLLTLLFTYSTCSAQIDSTINDPGDIAFLAWSRSNQDGYAFVFLDECPSNTVIRFIDEEWTGSSFYSPTGEGENKWTNSTGSMIKRGTVIIIQNADNNPTCNLGTVTESDAGFEIASTDQIFAISGTRSNPTFLAMIGHSTLPNNGTGSRQTLSNTGLTLGANAIHLTNEALYVGSTTCDSTITHCRSKINSDSNWTSLSTSNVFPNDVASSLDGTALPVELLSFVAKKTNQTTVDLQWHTAMELNNMGFMLQQYNQTNDEWSFVTYVQGVGNSFAKNSYSFKHNLQSTDVKKCIYRLIQMDYDGKETIVGQASCNLNTESNTFMITQTYFDKKVTIRNIESEAVVTLINSNGQIISKSHTKKSEFEIDLSTLTKGIYTVTVTTPETFCPFKMIVN